MPEIWVPYKTFGDAASNVGGVQVQGFDAITAQNGWAMAATGACIVITGLSVLSFIISQLHRILGLFDKKETAPSEAVKETKAQAPAVASDTDPLLDLEATAKLYRSLTAQLGESFGLAQLYQALEVSKDPHPHITVRELKASGYLATAEEGQFSWKNI